MSDPHVLLPSRLQLKILPSLVEVAPIYDNSGETTALAAAEIVHALIGLMVNPGDAEVD